MLLLRSRNCIPRDVLEIFQESTRLKYSAENSLESDAVNHDGPTQWIWFVQPCEAISSFDSQAGLLLIIGVKRHSSLFSLSEEMQ